MPPRTRRAVTILDAATGETVKTLEGTAQAEEVIVAGRTVLTLIGDPKSWDRASAGTGPAGKDRKEGLTTAAKTIAAFHKENGKRLWAISPKDVVPLSLIALETSVYYLDGNDLHCRRLADGGEDWSTPCKTAGSMRFLNSKGPTVVFAQGAVLVHTGRELMVFSGQDGKLQSGQKGGKMGSSRHRTCSSSATRFWAQGGFGTKNNRASRRYSTWQRASCRRSPARTGIGLITTAAIATRRQISF